MSGARKPSKRRKTPDDVIPVPKQDPTAVEIHTSEPTPRIKFQGQEFAIGAGETFTIDTGAGGSGDIILTSSATANAVLASLRLLGPSPKAQIADRAIRLIADMSDAELRIQRGLLADEGELPDVRYGGLAAASVKDYIDTEIEGRRKIADNKSSLWRDLILLVIGGAVSLLLQIFV